VRALILAGLLLGIPALAAAQSEAVARPEVKVGDRWLYKHVDYRKQAAGETREERVTFASAAAIHTVVRLFSIDGDTDATYTSSWNGVSSYDGGVITPHGGTLRFPLRVGDSYPADFENRRPRRGGFYVTHKRTARVIGWEDVEVPAGRFRALRIEVEGTFQRHDRDFTGKTRSVIWYVPSIKRWVKWTYEDSNQRGPVDAWGDELIDFKVQ
jgi:hypothetical protein